MLRQALKRCRACVGASSNHHAHLHGHGDQWTRALSSGSETASSRVPHYLLPPAYREHGGGERDERRHNDDNFRQRRSRGHPSPHHRQRFPRSNNNINMSPRQHRNRKYYFGKRGRRRSRGSQDGRAGPGSNGNGIPDVESIRRLEDSLAERMGEFMGRSGGGADSGSGSVDSDDAAKTTDYLEDLLRVNVPSDNEPTDSCTDEFYEKTASDFESLITGWSVIAESICAAKRMESRSDDDGDGTRESNDKNPAAVLLSDYEDAVLRAERHLESFEAFRDRFDAASAKEEEKQSSGGSGEASPVIGSISSFLSDFFFMGKPTTDDAFERSWTRADGKYDASSEDDSTAECARPKVRDSHRITALYERILLANRSSYRFGSEAKESATQRSNRLLNRWISLYCSTEPNKLDDTSLGSGHDDESNNVDMTSSDVRHRQDGPSGGRDLFHTVIRQNVDLLSVEGLERAESWLRTMRSLAKSGRSDCMPNVHTYNLLLLGYCNLSKRLQQGRSRSPVDVKGKNEERAKRAFVLDGVERLILELAQGDGRLGPNTSSLNLALNSFAKAGFDTPLASCQRTNSLIYKVFGEENYRDVFMCVDNKVHSPDPERGEAGCEVDSDEDEAVQDEKSSVHPQPNSDQEEVKLAETASRHPRPNLDSYHFLVDIYSASGNIGYIKRAKTLLKRMIRERLDHDSDHFVSDGSHYSHASFAPSSGTYNKVLHALVERGEDVTKDHTKARTDANRRVDVVSLLERTDAGRRVDRATKVAQEATDFLDSMVLYASSFPTPFTLLCLLQLWQKTASPEAGEQAERLITRMEVMRLYHREWAKTPFATAYKLALECWLTAARAGRPGAAERAFRLLQMIEMQVEGDRTEYKADEVVTALPFSHTQMYSMMLKICAASEKQDTSEALTIAFEVYHKMVDGGIDPGLETFEMMYTCVRKFLDHHPEADRDLLQKVFDLAEENGITRGEVIQSKRGAVGG